MERSQRPSRDIYQEVTDEIVTALEQGVAPWARPWKTGRLLPGANPIFPVNIRGTSYRGVNVLLLWAVAQNNAYTSNLWLTFRQAQEMGGTVRRGERSTPVVLWRFLRVAKATSGDAEEGSGSKTIPIIRHYNVFNLDQTEGVEIHLAEGVDKGRDEKGDWVDGLIESTGARIVHGGDRAVYCGGTIDKINLPPRPSFNSRESYYATLWHELTHWTGHEARLARDLTGRFGSQAYAAEELVAELGSAFCCAHCELKTEHLQHPEYIGTWIQVLKDDKRAIFTASAKAKAAAEYLIPAMKPEEEAEDQTQSEQPTTTMVAG